MCILSANSSTNEMHCSICASFPNLSHKLLFIRQTHCVFAIFIKQIMQRNYFFSPRKIDILKEENKRFFYFLFKNCSLKLFCITSRTCLKKNYKHLRQTRFSNVRLWWLDNRGSGKGVAEALYPVGWDHSWAITTLPDFAKSCSKIGFLKRCRKLDFFAQQAQKLSLFPACSPAPLKSVPTFC